MMRTILVSVTDKTGLDEFLRRLEQFDQLRLIATSSTARYLLEKGFACTTVEALTGFPEILSGRVKTLHPRVFAGILARAQEDDRSCLADMEIPEIDMVVVNLYRFEDKLGEGLGEAEMIEHIDVGGVALLRAAAKNFERVAVISNTWQYDQVLTHMQANDGRLTSDFRKCLAYEAFIRTSRYDASISSYLGGRLKPQPAEDESHLPKAVTVHLRRHQVLRYGENPHQDAGWYALSRPEASDPDALPPDVTFPPFEQLQGKELSSNNITDAYAAVKILRDIGPPGVCIIKHNNPCGVARGKDIGDAFERAYNCDPVSAFGGVYGLTEQVDGQLAQRIIESFVEIVLAPDFDERALTVFSKKKNIRLLRHRVHKLVSPHTTWHLRDLQDFGWILEIDREPPVVPSKFRLATIRTVDPAYMDDVAFSWAVVQHLTSNAIFVARDLTSLGFGIGQTSRVGSVELALAQAGNKARGAVLASDGFFPATDNIAAAARAGIAVIVQPGGSIKDDDVIAACNDAGIAMLFTGQRCFRH